MSKLTQIENGLRAVNPAGFQRLCDALLYQRGHRSINPIGLVIGADKVKRGTPDTLVPLADGHYVFAEYTTQQTDVAAKFLDDLGKCFDEEKTGIPANRIREFIACHTSVLSSEDEHALVEEGRRLGCLVTVLGLGPISHDLFHRFPGLARDFLGVNLDTGQILTLEEYVSAYGKSAISTPLDGALRYRDDEVKRALEHLLASDVLVVSGAAGVGKSRIALEICRQLESQFPGAMARVVLYRGLDLFQDVKTHFAAPGMHVVLVDDANRVSGFDHVLHLLHEQRPDRQVKIIATVRDYALDTVLETTRAYGTSPIQKIQALSDEQIRRILIDDYQITHHLYYERIVEIAKGNPRLAVMAARIAVREQNLQSLANVSVLYDEYFRSIRADLVELRDADVLRAAGVIALFRNVDRLNEAQMAVIDEVFSVSEERLWAAVRRLHELELVDLYEDEVARISDQVLATYLFHWAFFAQPVLSVGGFFHPTFFPSYRSRLLDAVNPAVNAFDGAAIAAAIGPALSARWEMLEKEGAELELTELVKAFGGIEVSKTLLFLQKRIAYIPADTGIIPPHSYSVATSSESPLWEILGHFRGHDLPVVRICIDLALQLVTKRVTDVPEGIRFFSEQLGIRHNSYLRDYDVQVAVVDALSAKHASASGDHRTLVAHVFLKTALKLLRTKHQTHEAKGGNAISILTFNVAMTAELVRLRHAIWREVGALLADQDTRAITLPYIAEHVREAFYVDNAELIAADAEVAIPVLGAALDERSLSECNIVQSYVSSLRRREMKLSGSLESDLSELSARFSNAVTALSDVLLDDYSNRRERASMGWKEYEDLKNDELRSLVAELDAAGIERLLESCGAIFGELRKEQLAQGEPAGSGHGEWQLKDRVGRMLKCVATRDPAVFAQVLDDYLAGGDQLLLDPRVAVPDLIRAVGSERAFAIITSHTFAERGRWLIGFFAALPEDETSGERLAHLLDYYRSAKVSDLTRSLRSVRKFKAIDEEVTSTIVAILITKAEQDPRFGWELSDLFWIDNIQGEGPSAALADDVRDTALLKKAYVLASRADSLFDHNAEAFGRLLDRDPGFASEWVNAHYEAHREDRLGRHDDGRDYSKLWMRSDYASVMRSILEAIRARPEYEVDSYASSFLKVRQDEKSAHEMRKRQVELLRAWIAEWATNTEHMTFVFDLAVGLTDFDRRDIVAEFLKYNVSFADFAQLALEPSGWSWSGSEVPILQGRIEFFQALLPLCDRIELLEHRQWIEVRIERLRSQVEAAKKRDFLER